MARKVKREFVDLDTISDETMADVPRILSKTLLANLPSSSAGSTIPSDDAEMTDYNVSQSTVHTGSSRKKTSMRHSENSPTGSDSGLTIMGQGVKQLIGAVQKLRHLGIEDLGLPLPKIVVVGDQSTGKSSLIEGMSEIKVPRNVGTCTRCPLEINLTESSRTGDPWKCEIFLYKKYLYENPYTKGNPSKIGYEGATRARPLGAYWVPQDPESFPFATLSSKDRVASVLRLAQLATLNPSSSYERYLPGQPNPGDTIQVKFSPNVVRLEIAGPGLPEIAFFDLPGVISQSEVPGEQYLVDLVKNLVKEYIKDDNCINLLALSMTDDPTNSTASSLVRKVKAEARTVGVLTKPDRRQQGESQMQWLEMLQGQRFQLGSGYFVVKNNPDSAVDHATARVEEREYFLMEEPWATAWNRYSDRFGTLQLQTFLSQKLTAQIIKSLPRVTAQVERKAAAINKELETLPEPPAGNPSILVIQSLNDFETNIKKLIDGDISILIAGEVSGWSFWKDWNNLAMTFRGVMEDSRPLLMMDDSTDSVATRTPTKHRHDETVEQDEEFSDTEFASSYGTKRRCIADGLNEQTPKEETFTKRAISGVPVFTPEKNGSKPQSDRRFATRFSLSQIRDIIREGVPGLPGQIDTRTVDRVIKMSLQKWDKPLSQFLNRVERLCCDMFLKHVDKIFGPLRATALYARVVEICDCFLKDAMATQRQAAHRALQLELHKPACFNAEGLKMADEKALSQIQASRHNYRALVYVNQQEQRNNKGSVGLNKEDKVAKVSDTQLGSDPYSQEVHIMGSVRGYYECAFSRFVDVVCQGIQGELFLSCRNEIGAVLREGIGILKPDANTRCTVLLAVNQESQERRVQLMKEKAVIDEAQDWLEGLTRNADNVLPAGKLRDMVVL